jgi:protoporphyrinogen oxidase
MDILERPQILRFTQACVLGAGVTGLTVALSLDRHDIDTILIEGADAVGGLARTFDQSGFRFDLGGHRFFSKSPMINRFIEDLMGDEMIEVERKSSIYYKQKFFEYPLRVPNVLQNLGTLSAAKVLADFGLTKVKRTIRRCPTETVEDWMVGQFGETLYNIFFRSYTAKIWGLPGNQLSQEWAGQRIRGFSLASAVKHAFLKSSKSRPKTLIERFTYPRLGIGRICERMVERIGQQNRIYLNSKVTRIHHEGGQITSVDFESPTANIKVQAKDYVSSIPLTAMLNLMKPLPPAHVMDAAREITFRGLAIVHLIIDKVRVTDQTWIYVQDPDDVVSRIHEPKNWSPDMVPAGMTSLVVEIPCSLGDDLWVKSNDELADLAIDSLEKNMNFIRREQVLGTRVIRLPRAYPVYHLGYEPALKVLLDYVQSFKNMQTVGRAGLHKYVNIDHCIECGILAAKNILGSSYDLSLINSQKEYLEEVAS